MGWATVSSQVHALEKKEKEGEKGEKGKKPETVRWIISRDIWWWCIAVILMRGTLAQEFFH